MNILTIARFTLQEAVSRRLILAGVVISLIFVALYALGFQLAYAHQVEVSAGARARVMVAAVAEGLTLFGLYAVYFLASILALFVSVGSISGEIDAGTLHAVLARPVSRAQFILGRWLGLAGIMAAYVAVMSGLLMIIARIISGYEVPDAPRAIGLMMLEAIVLLTVSLFGSTLLSTLANGVVAFTLFGLAWLGGIIEFLGGMLSNDTMLNLATVVSLLVPSDAIWRGASYFIQSPVRLASGLAGSMPFASQSPLTTPFLLWSLLYPLLFIGVAVYAFSRRDL